MRSVSDFAKCIKTALTQNGASVRRASLKAGLPVRAIQNVMDGHEPSLSRVGEICDAVGLEFYIGPPRGRPDSVITDHVGVDSLNIDAICDQVASLRSDMSDRLSSTQSAIDTLTAAITNEKGEIPVASPVSVIEVQAAAGGGTMVDMEEITGHVWFRRDWLDANAIDPGQSVIMKVKGESMEPVLMDGAAILVDRTRTRRRAGHIYVIRTDDGLVAKRLGRNRKGAWQLESAHPEYRPFAWDRFMEVIGEVRWTARTLPTPRDI